MGYLASMRIWRGNSADGQLEEHKVEVSEGEVVLDVIHRLQATETPDLAVRWNCKAGKCGSCLYSLIQSSKSSASELKGS